MEAQLEHKVQRAIKLIQAVGKIAKEHGQPLEVAYSGGKDSDVILELTKMAGVEYRAIYKNTTIDPPKTITHAREMGVEVVHPKHTFKQIIESNCMPNRWRRFCCRILKEYKILDYVIIGVRRQESHSRARRYNEPEKCRVFNKKKDIKRREYYPILDWTGEDVKEFISIRGIKCHQLYYDEQGNFHAERRLGCMCCPLQSTKKRIQSFKEHPKMVRFYIKAAKKYMETHPVCKTTKLFDGNYYDWFTSEVFCISERDFRKRFGASDIFGDDAIDTKAFLENQFNINL